MRPFWVRIVELSLLDNVRQSINSESELFRKGLEQAIKDRQAVGCDVELEKYQYGVLLLRRALGSLVPRARFFLLKPVNWPTYIQTRIRILVNPKSEEKPLYFYYETFGYRFVILLDLKLRKGSVIHLCRICKPCNNDPKKCLSEAMKLTKSVEPLPITT